MRYYNRNLKHFSRRLRTHMTESERILWSRLRRKQLLGIQFYRQKPLGNYIVDFYAPQANLIIEVDGSQHFEDKHAERDRIRDEYLSIQGFRVLKFNNRQVKTELDAVVTVVFQEIEKIFKTCR